MDFYRNFSWVRSENLLSIPSENLENMCRNIFRKSSLHFFWNSYSRNCLLPQRAPTCFFFQEFIQISPKTYFHKLMTWIISVLGICSGISAGTSSEISSWIPKGISSKIVQEFHKLFFSEIPLEMFQKNLLWVPPEVSHGVSLGMSSKKNQLWFLQKFYLNTFSWWWLSRRVRGIPVS